MGRVPPPTLIFVLVAILTLRWWLSLGYATHTPAWEAYDEPYHAGYAAWIGQGGSLPPPPDNAQRIQPPAYYLIMAGFGRLAQVDFGAFAYPERNPYFYAPNGGVRYAPPRPDPFVPSLIMLRLASALLSLLTVAVSYRAARLVLPVWGAVGAAGIVALWPQYAFNGSMFTNDAGAALIGAVILWRILAVGRHGPGGGRLILAAAACLIGLVVKLSVAPLFLALPVALIRHVPARRLLRIGLIGVVSVAVAVLILSQQPGVLLPFLLPSPSGDPAPLALIRYLTEGRHTLIWPTLGYGLSSTFGLFGWGNVPLPPIFTGLWVVGLAAVALGGLIGRGWRGRGVVAAALLSLIGAGVALSVYYSNIGLLNGRYVLPGLAAWGILASACSLAFGKRGRHALIAVLIGLIALNFWVAWAFIPAVYARPTPLVPNAPVPNPRFQRLAPGVALIGLEIATPIQREIPLCAYWEAVETPRAGYTLRLEFITRDGVGYGWIHTLPAGGNYPTDQWVSGVRFRDCSRLPIRADFPAPATGYVKISVLDGAGRVLGSFVAWENPIAVASAN